ncbi:MAG TPA: hypothetical protein VF622_17060 [Segetibacter sp.]
MAAKNNTYDRPPIPKQELDNILYYLVMQRIRYPGDSSTVPAKKHPHFLFQYYKSFHLISRLRGHALSLLMTQYAKKPKNPV